MCVRFRTLLPLAGSFFIIKNNYMTVQKAYKIIQWFKSHEKNVGWDNISKEDISIVEDVLPILKDNKERLDSLRTYADYYRLYEGSFRYKYHY